MDILERLRAKVGFTSTEIKIADYVLGHYHQLPGMSANALAKATFSSNASVIRMCRKMGLSGYREFQIALSAYLSNPQNGGKRTPRHAVQNAVMELIFNAILEAADNCRSYVSQESLARVSDWMSQANRLYLYSAACFNALALCHMMSGFGVAVSAPDLFNETPYKGKENLEGDVALFIAYAGGAAQEAQKKMASLKKRGCRVIAISSESACPDADIFIRLPQGEPNCPYAERAYLQTALLYVTACINCMIGAVKTPK
ncbi:MAG: MurR/RpiR family transcriptional regulator [Oscillibacter sp.]|nr:MurR/RpiR family transcriptional regulator [Oscillibacter sp.]